MWVKLERDENMFPLIRYLGTQIQRENFSDDRLANKVLVFYTGGISDPCNSAIVSGNGPPNMNAAYGDTHSYILNDHFTASVATCKLKFACNS